MDSLTPFEQKLKDFAMDAKTAIEVAGDVAINHWKSAQDEMLKWDIELAKVQNDLSTQNPDWTEAKIKRVSKTSEAYERYNKAKNFEKRIQEIIRIAKKHAEINSF